ncbi:MAG: 4Fe-4S dicluster domain-containing protein [Candidatus Tectomicrobia bacterium]|uniref:4Fe-4S dicluster domain-containing protein n=1 Tax=Tectimicrobiota bacterium TaxID=2528274 RepID=A0A933GM69_UNCTE|nr:4Fe-4S dicluster domain-containing protein [Candidatus Tectomicrobia bacterium]
MDYQITREIFWNLAVWVKVVIYPIALIFIVMLINGTWNRVELWRLGQDKSRLRLPKWEELRERLEFTLTSIFSHSHILRWLYPGCIHFLIFWGVFLLFLGTCIIFIQEDITKPIFGYQFLYGSFYLYYSLILDMAGVAGIVGVILAVHRRYMTKPRALDNLPTDSLSLIWLLVVLLTGFGVEGLRIALTKPWFEVYSPIGWELGKLFIKMHLGPNALSILHGLTWWAHFIISLGFIAYVAYSKLFHIFSSSLNTFLRSTGIKGALKPITNFEEAEVFGVTKLEDFTWKELLDGDACTRCGRCQENCPAFISDKPLNPKKITLDHKKQMEVVGAATGESVPPLIGGDGIIEDEIWACTTCRACQEHCPVFIEQMEKIVEMRRGLVLMESRFPAEVQPFFRNMEVNSNPWGIGREKRADWAIELGVPIAAEHSEFELLYWVGCAGAFEDRNKRIAASMVKILKKAGVNFAILGNEEGCCGDAARRIGQEYLFQTLALKNIEVMKKYGVKRILAACPHGYNTLKNEYPQFGGNYEVIHSTEFIFNLLRQGQIAPEKGVFCKAAYHDSCYLGRYNDIYEQPRVILEDLPGLISVDFERKKTTGYCCGGGGGRMWMEESIGRRIAHVRTEEAIKIGAGVIATACPFCMIQLNDAVKDLGKEDTMRVMDIIELVAQTL